jgi:hypothetical protein
MRRAILIPALATTTAGGKHVGFRIAREGHVVWRT